MNFGGGSQSIIKLIKYEKNNYTSYSILKSSTDDNSDNPYYEYLVGNFLNSQSKFFPCFVQTYGLFEYMDLDTFNYFKNCRNDCDLEYVKNCLIPVNDANIDDNLIKSCTKKLCILTQYLKNSFSIKKALEAKYPQKYDEEYDEWYEDRKDWKYALNEECNFYVNDILYILFQIYMPLYTLADIFTHYDLHWNNVLLHEPIKGKVIKYVYHLDNDEIISFYSPYLVKIIDYGRCYFSDDIMDSNIIYDKICSFAECNPECGRTKGYGTLKFYKKRNISIDLRLLDYFLTDGKLTIKIINDNLKEIDVKPNKNEKDLNDIEILNNKLYIFNQFIEFKKKLILQNIVVI